MRVVVTGTSGLIGSAVVRGLEGAEIVSVGRRESSYLIADFSDPPSVMALSLSGIEAVVHCAGIVDEDLIQDRGRAFRQAIQGMSALAERARDCGVRKFVYISSAHVYGSLNGRITERVRPNPLSDYAIAHFASEQILRRACGPKFSGAVVRPCAVFGIPLDLKTFRRWSLIPFAFPRDAIQKGIITLKSSGNQMRNFVGADDVAATVRSLLSTPPRSAFAAVNAVGSYSSTVFEFAQLCAKIAEKCTGRSCGVVRSETIDADESNFIYASSDPGYLGRTDIRVVVGQLMQLLRNEAQSANFGE